jgi:UDP-glucose 4-epimerase
VYDNLQTGHSRAVKGADFIQGDLKNSEKLRETFGSHTINAVMHFAADCLVGESVEEPLKYFKNNVNNSIRLLEIMEEFNVKKFVFSSSAAVYGEPKEIPIKEDHPCTPTNPYGETKWIFEKVLHAYHKGGRLDYVALRYFNAAGGDPEGELGEDHFHETHLIPLILKAALNGNTVLIYGTDYNTIDGTCVRDYIHVTDLAHAHVLALKKLEQGRNCGIYNLGNGNGYSIRQVIEVARKVTGKKIIAVESPRRLGDPARLVASSEKIKKELGWDPKYPDLETIIETAWQWHRKHPDGYKDKA